MQAEEYRESLLYPFSYFPISLDQKGSDMSIETTFFPFVVLSLQDETLSWKIQLLVSISLRSQGKKKESRAEDPALGGC